MNERPAAGGALEVMTWTEVASSVTPATHDLPDRADDAAVPCVTRAEFVGGGRRG
jgi:hypothetical protein